MGEIDQFMIRELEFDLSSVDVATRRHALVSLARVEPSPQVLAIIRHVADEDPAEELRYLAKKFYNDFQNRLDEAGGGGVEVVRDGLPDEARFRAVMASEDQPARIGAVKELEAGGSPAVLPWLLDSLDTERDTWVLASLVKAIGLLGDASVVPAIQPYLNHDDPRVQANTVEALEAVGDDVVFPLLVPMLNRKDNRVRANAVKALLSYDHGGALDTLEGMARSPKEWMRDSSLYCLSLVEDDRVEGILVDMLEAERIPDLMKKEADLLAKLGTAAAVGPLALVTQESGRDKAIVVKYALGEIRTRLGCDDAEVVRLRDLARVARIARRPPRATPTDTAAMTVVPGDAGGEASSWHVWLGASGLAVAAAVAIGAAVSGSGALPLPSPTTRPSGVPAAALGPAFTGNVFDAAPSGRGASLSVIGVVRRFDERDGTILVDAEGRQILVKAGADTAWATIKPGVTLRVAGVVVGHTRFGAVYVRGTKVAVAGS